MYQYRSFSQLQLSLKKFIAKSFCLISRTQEVKAGKSCQELLVQIKNLEFKEIQFFIKILEV